MKGKDQLLFQSDPSFDWNAPADGDLELGNYFQGAISKELSDRDGRLIGQDIHETYFTDGVNNESEYMNALMANIAEYTGIDTPPTRREMFMMFSGFKAGRFMEKLNNQMPCSGKNTKVIKTSLNELIEVLGKAIKEEPKPKAEA